MHYYKLALEKNNFKITHCRKVDDALQAIAQVGDSFNLVILDSAMPPGKAYAKQPTEDGTLTGQLLFQDIRKALKEIPILILTNFFGLEWVQAALKEKKVRANRKIDVGPFKLVEIVKEMIKEK